MRIVDHSMLGSRRFGDAQLERLYQMQQISQNSTLLLYSLCVLVASLLLMAINHLFTPGLELLLSFILIVSAIILLMLLILSSIESKPKIINFVVIWIYSTVIITISGGGQSGLIPCIISYFLFYTVFTFDLPLTISLSVFLSIIQIIGFVLLPTDPFTIHQVCS